MVSRYKPNSIPMSGTAPAYNNYPQPWDYCEPNPISVTIQSPLIKRGETVKFSTGVWNHIGRLRPTHFIYTGSKDLWLLAGSSARGACLFPTDIHLDSFRVGAPCEIAWGTLFSGDLFFQVEHRTKIKNAQPAQFIARIVGLAEQ